MQKMQQRKPQCLEALLKIRNRTQAECSNKCDFYNARGTTFFIVHFVKFSGRTKDHPNLRKSVWQKFVIRKLLQGGPRKILDLKWP